ncbi:MAG TPA: amino acid adenylation domain-containing protein, partial [Rhizobacter sp.]|nr:amino acid adenylation domain-containing protein [Rhizobacter sp.]
MQQRLWFLEQFEPGRLTYNTPSAHRLRGPLDVAALEQSFNEMIRRQAILRTALADEDGTPFQRILPELRVSLTPLEDLSTLPQADRDPALMRLLQKRVEESFDLRQAPLFKLGLYKLDAQEHVLFFMPHHIIWDGWSFDLFHEEMTVLYAAYSHGHEPDLAPLAKTYGDFARWQQAWMQSDDLPGEVSYWKDTLKDLPEPLDLPLDRPRPAHMSGQGGAEPISRSVAQIEAVRSFGRGVDATPFMTLLANYAALLHRITGQTDMVIGTPVRGRHSDDVEKIMGFFVNALPLRIRVDPQASFVDLVRHVREVVLSGFSYPDVPFEHLVRALNVSRDLGRSPIYQAFFSYQDARLRPAGWGDLNLEQVHLFQPGAAEDLGLWFLEHTKGLAGGLTYNTDVFSGDTAGRLVDRFHHLLEAAIASPHEPLARLAVTPPAELQSLQAWNQTRVAYQREASVASLIGDQAARTPEAIAVRCEEQSCSYAELEARANRLARSLRMRGIGRGAMVGLCIGRSLEMLVAQLAILKSGAAYVPLDPGFPADRLAYMAEDAGLALLVSHSSLVEALPWVREECLLVDTAAALIADQSGEPLAPDAELDAHPDDPAYVIYTSGSTGRPKGVMVPHAAVVNFLTSMAAEPGLSASDRLLAVTTLSFDIAVLELLLPLTVGAQVVMANAEQVKDGVALRALLESSGTTVMQATPSTWHMLIDAGWQGSSSFKALIGGEGLPPALARQLLDRTGELWNMYGPTETTVWSTCWKVEKPEEGIFIGRPIANTQIHVLDEHQQRCSIGVSGEIYIGGEGVTLGYLKRPELTAERFIADPFSGVEGAKLYRTGDRGRWRHDGLLEHLGRLDFQVKVRGYRIELGEIESNLVTHPSVTRSVVIVREDQPGDARLVAYVVPGAAKPEAGVLRAHLRLSLPEYMLPQHVVQIDGIPLLPNGKINRQALPPPVEAADSHDLVHEGAGNDTEMAMAEIWQSLLGVARVGVTDNFFELGGHSMLVLRLMVQIEKRFGRKVPLSALMEAPTVRQLVAWMERQTALESLVLIRPGKGSAPIFMVHDGDGETLLYRNLA